MSTRVSERLDDLIETMHSSLIRSQAQLTVVGRDTDGTISHRIGSRKRALGVLLFASTKDVSVFAQYLVESAKAQVSLFERYDRGEAIAASYVAMLSYKELLDALAAGDMKLAQQLASLMGGRPKLEKEHDHPFDLAMGYSLRALVLNRPDEAELWLPKLKEKSSRSDIGYPLALSAILNRNGSALDEAVDAILAGHTKKAKGNGIFAGSEDELLCVWGIGIANLALSRGVSVTPRPPLIPCELLRVSSD